MPASAGKPHAAAEGQATKRLKKACIGIRCAVGKARFHQPRRQLIQLVAVLFQALDDIYAGIVNGTAHQTGVEKISGLNKGGGRYIGRHLDHPVFNDTLGGNHDHQGTPRVQANKLNMAQR